MDSSSMTPADLAAVTGGNAGEGSSFFWIFALLILLFGGGNGFGFGGNNGRASSEISGYEIGLLAGNNATKDNQMALSNQINTTSCNTDATVHSVATNLGNGIASLGYENLRNFTNTQQEIANSATAVATNISNLGTNMNDGFCQTKQAIGDVRYDMANFAAAINANTTAQVQKVLDSNSANRIADMQNQINNLQLQSSLCNVVRYPTPAYLANTCGCGCS